MVRIRRIEERIALRYRDQEMRCPTHLCIGQEAAPAGVCAALGPDDVVMSGHRSHGHYLAKGGDLRAMIAELYGRVTGCSSGKGGSMHLVDLGAGFLGATPIVASTIAIATGAALAAKLRGEKRVAVAFFGDAAIEAGVANEALAFAALERLPIVFVCENNRYSTQTPLAERQPSGVGPHDVARGHGVESHLGKEDDVFEIASLAERAVEKARDGGGPSFLEHPTYRWREHCGPEDDDHLGYRPPGELESIMQHCPIERTKARLRSEGVVTDAQIAGWEAEIAAEIDDAFAFARRSPYPRPSALLEDVAAPPVPHPEPPADGPSRTYAEAIHEALDLALARDPRVYVMGLGVPDVKGVFGTTKGLAPKHGAARVRDMPTAENGMTGVAIGTALSGMRPVLTHQRVDFALLSIDPLVNQAAKWRYMFGGRSTVPLVVRMIVGRGWGQGAQHAQSLHAWFAHVPGLKVLVPATPRDAKGLLLAAIDDDDPVILLEHRWLYGIEGPVPEGHYAVPIGRARVVRAGSDVTIVGASHMTLEATRAAETLATEGVSADVVDLRSLRPLDTETILESVSRTRRLVVADTGWQAYGVASEIAAVASEHGWNVPLRRVGLPPCPSPSTPALAALFFPRAVDVVDAVHELLGLPPSPRDPSDVPLDVPDPSFTGPF
jgi:2-oxoisovalerate dehydrogenase E1 component